MGADQPESSRGFWANLVGGIARSTIGGSIVTHMTWVVIAGIAGVAVIACSPYADSVVKKIGMGLAAFLATLGVGALIWASYGPLANVLGKDIPKAMGLVKKKGQPAKEDPAAPAAPPPVQRPRRKEKANG